VGQFTFTVPRGYWISAQVFDDVGRKFAPASGTGNGINAGCSAVLRLQPNPLMDEVCVEAMVKCDAGNRSTGLGTLLHNLGFEELGIGTAC